MYISTNAYQETRKLNLSQSEFFGSLDFKVVDIEAGC